MQCPKVTVLTALAALIAVSGVDARPIRKRSKKSTYAVRLARQVARKNAREAALKKKAAKNNKPVATKEAPVAPVVEEVVETQPIVEEKPSEPITRSREIIEDIDDEDEDEDFMTDDDEDDLDDEDDDDLDDDED